MPTLDQIFDSVISAMQADAALSSFSAFHKVEGVVPAMSPTFSVWAPKQKYKAYDNDNDQVNVEIHIGVSLRDTQVERGEADVRVLTEEIRLVLTADQMNLGGLIDDSFFDEWQFESTDSSKFQMLHLAEGIWNVTYYSPRSRPITPGQPLGELDFYETVLTD